MNSSEEAVQNAAEGNLWNSLAIWLPLGVILAILVVLGVIAFLNKRRVFQEPLDGAIRVKTPKANAAILYTFAGALGVGAILCWFLLPEDMEMRLVTQIILSVIAAALIVIVPLSIRGKTVAKGNHITHTPAAGKPREYTFDDIMRIEVRQSGFEGAAYKFIDKNGRKMFTLHSADPNATRLYDLAKAKNRQIHTIDYRTVVPPR